MIVLRKKPYYIISENPDLEKHILHPAVPNNFLTRGEHIDSKLPRISVFRSVSDAISATFLGQNLRPGTKMYVYEISDINPESLIGPLDVTKIPYFSLLKEWWYLKSCSPKFVSEIEIGKLKKEETYHYGPRQTNATLYKWEWSEIQKPWEKKFGPKLPKEKQYSNLTLASNQPLTKRGVRKLRRIERRNERRMKREAKLEEMKSNPTFTPTALDKAVADAETNLARNKALKSEGVGY